MSTSSINGKVSPPASFSDDCNSQEPVFNSTQVDLTEGILPHMLKLQESIDCLIDKVNRVETTMTAFMEIIQRKMSSLEGKIDKLESHNVETIIKKE